MNDETRKFIGFVIQSFDGAFFDRRYSETIRPGVVRGGAEPKRADDILGVVPIIQKIEQAIRSADLCIAEVSTDNPNVWLELGYALALSKPTLILCDKALRPRLPFDVQHRPVIFYSAESKSGFEDLEQRISAEVSNLVRGLAEEVRRPVLDVPTVDTAGLKGYEISILSALLAAWSTSPNGISMWELERKLERTGYSDSELALGVTRLSSRDLIVQLTLNDDRSGDEYFAYRISPEGIAWLLANEASIQIAPPKSPAPPNGFEDDDIPF